MWSGCAKFEGSKLIIWDNKDKLRWYLMRSEVLRYLLRSERKVVILILRLLKGVWWVKRACMIFTEIVFKVGFDF